jgi:chromosome partitioning protein
MDMGSLGDIVVVAMEKGGVGKTTLSGNVAVMSMLAGHDTLLVDADKQETSTGWADMRFENGVEPRVVTAKKTGKIGADLLSFAQKYRRVVVDVGGRDSTEMRQAVAVATHLIIPVQPSVFDTWSIDRMLTLIKDVEEKTGHRAPGRILINCASTSTNEVEETLEALDEYKDELPIFNTRIMDRVAFRRAARVGKALIEFEPKGAAADEIKQLYQEIFNESFRSAYAPAAEQQQPARTTGKAVRLERATST